MLLWFDESLAVLPFAMDQISGFKNTGIGANTQDHACGPRAQGVGIKRCDLFISLRSAEQTQIRIPQLTGKGQRPSIHIELSAMFDAADQGFDQNFISKWIAVLIFNKIDHLRRAYDEFQRHNVLPRYQLRRMCCA